MTICVTPSTPKRYMNHIIHVHGFYSAEVKAFRGEIEEAILLLLKNFHTPMTISLFHDLMQSQYYQAYHEQDIRETVMFMFHAGRIVWRLDRQIELPKDER